MGRVPPRVVFMVPARLHSSRLPKKMLRLLGNKPLVVQTTHRIAQRFGQDRVWVATEDQEIADACSTEGLQVVMTGTHDSGTSRLGEAATRLLLNDEDVVVNIQGDEPFADLEAVEQAVQLISAEKPMATLCYPIGAASAERDNPNVVKVVFDHHRRAMYFSRSTIPHIREGAQLTDVQNQVWGHIGVYIYTVNTLKRLLSLAPSSLEIAEGLEQLRALQNQIPIYCIESRPSLGVDTLHDFQNAERMFAAMQE